MSLSNSFLRQLAKKCFDLYGDQSDSLTIIFPNKRAGLFFRKYLSQLTNKPIWSPTVLSIEEFIIGLSKKLPSDSNRLLFGLYSIYKKKIKNAESFDAFYPWGEMILSDFNDIDNYLIDPDHIFKIVKSQKELDETFYYLPEEDQKTIQSFWTSFLPKPSKSQSDFLSTWEILGVLYREFNLLLDKKNISYKGKIYREVSESLDQLNTESKHIWFAGFNALTKTEEKLIAYFILEKKAEIFWDVDSYYLSDDMQEAGYFFRQYEKYHVFSKSIKRDTQQWIENRLKHLNVHAVTFSMGQVKSVGEKLADLALQDNFLPEGTVIILPDENLLLPMLNTIPESIEQVNVTMGYPIKNSNYFTFIEALLGFLVSLSSSKMETHLRSDPLLELLKHPLYNIVFADLAEDLVKDIVSKNQLFLDKDELPNDLLKLIKTVKSGDQNEVLIDALIELLPTNELDRLSNIDQASIYELHKLLTGIKTSAQEFGLSMDLKTLTRLYSKLGNSKIPFSGEPLSGLQIMGILETRNLDFEHVFILDMNEGVWPKDSSNSSFIPYNIRKAFDLPVVEHSDAIQSYLFYRLLHHSESINIYYNNVSEFNHSGELSRYVKQIQLESEIPITEKLLSNPLLPESIKPINVEKTEVILKELSKYKVDSSDDLRLSPSALNTFIDCRLKFYFKYIERIKEKDEVNQTLDPATFGNLLHHTMEFYYANLMNEKNSDIMEASDFTSIKKPLQAALKQAFTKENRVFEENINHNGQQIIVLKVIEKFATQIINYDSKYAPFQIKALEAGHEDGYVLDVPIETKGGEITIGLKGVIDRIDYKEGIVRILDYKSGGDERTFTSVESLFDRSNGKRNKAVLQVLLYCLFYKQNGENVTEKIVPGVFNSKDLFLTDFDLKIKLGRSTIIDDFSIVEEDYLQQLKILLEDLFDPGIHFDQTEDLKKCEYCPYIDICLRG